MTDAPTSPVAGWYPDPASAHGLRWWDGTGWTGHERAAVVAVSAPAPVDAPGAAFGSLAWRDQAAAANEAPTRSPARNSDGARFANVPATVALAAGVLAGVFFFADVSWHTPAVVQPLAVAALVALGVVGYARSRKTGTGLKRSIAGVAIGIIAQTLASYAAGAEEFTGIIDQITGHLH